MHPQISADVCGFCILKGTHMSTLLKVTNLTIEVAHRRLFENLNFELPANALTCITGENGVGKTTLVKHLLRDLDLNYTSHTTCHLKRSQVQYVPQLRNIDDDYPLSIRSFVQLGFKRRFCPWLNQAMKVKLEQVLAETNLTKIANQPLGHASGGEKQRAYLAQALCADPSLLILDEATASLDRSSKHELLKLLKQIMADRNLTILFITHDPELIAAYADYELNLDNHTATVTKKG